MKDTMLRGEPPNAVQTVRTMSLPSFHTLTYPVANITLGAYSPLLKSKEPTNLSTYTNTSECRRHHSIHISTLPKHRQSNKLSNRPFHNLSSIHQAIRWLCLHSTSQPPDRYIATL